MARVSRFYSMSYQEVMDMPLRGFWSFNAQIRRLRAEENLNAMDLALLGGFGVDSKTIQSVRSTYTETMGEPMKADRPPQYVEPGQHQKGLAQLRAIQALMGGGAQRQPNDNPQPQS